MEIFVRDIIMPFISCRGWTAVCEIGASQGKSTDLLASLPQVSVTVIDPCFDCDLAARYAGNPRVTVHKANSLDVLPTLRGPFDCILIDGDHNWYTVYNELSVIAERELLRRGGVIFLHDVGWPYGRRDMYYQPDTIPSQYRHAYDRAGVVRGRKELSADGVNAFLYNAKTEGGPCNGVLTAIEDFLRRHRGDYQFALIRAFDGVGAIHYRSGLADNFKFLNFRVQITAANLLTLPKRFAKDHFPAAYQMARSLVGRS